MRSAPASGSASRNARSGGLTFSRAIQRRRSPPCAKPARRSSDRGGSRPMPIAAFFTTHTLDQLLSQYGYAAVFAFVMIESLGVPFPGETMVIAAALFAGAHHSLSAPLIWLVAAAGAIIGDNIGFGIGHWGGYRVLYRYGSKIRFDEAKLKVGRLIFDRHGGKVVFFGRFVSVLRTYAAFLAGTLRMPYLEFLAYNAAGGIVWSAIYAFGFYYAGSSIESARGP